MTTTTAYDLAQRFVGVHEITGERDAPVILWMLQLCDGAAQHDEIAWCSAFVNAVAWLLRLPRSKSLAARSWLAVGRPVPLADARPEFDVVILNRGTEPQPGPEELHAPGHVGYFAGLEGDRVLVLGGNQGDSVSVASFPVSRVLGVRRLADD